MRAILFCILTLFSLNAFSHEIYTEGKLGVAISPKDPEFVIKLKSNPTTGYSWFLRTYDTRFLTPLKHSFEGPTDKKLMGAPGFEVWTFQVKPAAFAFPQQTLLRFVYSRPWDGNEQPKQIVFKVSSVADSH